MPFLSLTGIARLLFVDVALIAPAFLDQSGRAAFSPRFSSRILPIAERETKNWLAWRDFTRAPP